MTTDGTESSLPSVSGPTFGSKDRVVPGDSVEPLVLLAFSQNLRSVGVAELETCQERLEPYTLRRWFESEFGILELAWLRTCQRMELFVLVRGLAVESRLSAWLSNFGPWETCSGRDATRRLYRVAAGLESLAPGEREVQDQVRRAATRVLSRHPRPVLRPLLGGATRAAGDFLRPTASIADVAVDWLSPRIPRHDPEVLVLGGGTVGRRVVERLAPVARVTVIYHHHPPNSNWLARWRVRAAPARDLSLALSSAAAVVAAAKTTGRILRMEDLPADPTQGPRWFVDLGLPRNLDPAIGARRGVELVDLGGLRGVERRSGAWDELGHRTELAADAGYAVLARASMEPWIDTLQRRAERIRSEEWQGALNHAGPVSDQARHAFRRLSERVVRRLLSGPTSEMRSLPPGPEFNERRRRLLESFGERDPDR